MSDSFTSINVHIIFHIKSGGVPMEENHLPRIFDYIGGTIRSMSGISFIVGGRSDHIHILCSAPVSISLSDFVRGIKANTSRWIKRIDGRYSDFSWQAGYGAFSVSESNKDIVIKYIKNQKEHHNNQSAFEKFRLFIQKHGFDVNDIGRIEN